jgi:hypothetical protein
MSQSRCKLWPALENGFGPKGACNGYWSMDWRINAAYRQRSMRPEQNFLPANSESQESKAIPGLFYPVIADRRHPGPHPPNRGVSGKHSHLCREHHRSATMPYNLLGPALATKDEVRTYSPDYPQQRNGA